MRWIYRLFLGQVLRLSLLVGPLLIAVWSLGAFAPGKPEAGPPGGGNAWRSNMPRPAADQPVGAWRVSATPANGNAAPHPSEVRVSNGGNAWSGGNARPMKRPPAEAHPMLPARRGQMLTGPVTRIRDGDTIVVATTPIRIANLDCAEKGSRNGDRATRRMVELVGSAASLTCRQEGRRSYDREVGTCELADGRDIGEVMIREGYCERWRWN